MPVYFASDMHLRLDRPERAARLAQWVDTLKGDDSLYLVGDVCDFWFASRQRRGTDPLACQGLRSLAEFRSRGGALTILPGNHDLWLGPFYASTLGATLAEEPLIVEAYGKRIHLVHGHRTGGREPWKGFMESRAFLKAFEHLPSSVANGLDVLLDKRNERGRIEDEARLVEVFRHYLPSLDPSIDVAVFGHVHRPLDDSDSRPRLVVLDGWHQRTCYLRLDETGLFHFTEPALITVPAEMR